MVPIGLVTTALAIAFVPESRDPGVPRIDRPGFVISVAALGLLTWTIIEAPGHGWDSVETLSGFALSALLLMYGKVLGQQLGGLALVLWMTDETATVPWCSCPRS